MSKHCFLVPSINMPSSGLILTEWDMLAVVFFEYEFHQFALKQCQEMIYKYKQLFVFLQNYSACKRVLGGNAASGNTGVHLTLPGQNGHHFADNIFKCIFMNEKCCILIRISLKFVPNGPIDNKSSLFQVMAWCQPGDKPSPVSRLI